MYIEWKLLMNEWTILHLKVMRSDLCIERNHTLVFTTILYCKTWMAAWRGPLQRRMEIGKRGTGSVSCRKRNVWTFIVMLAIYGMGVVGRHFLLVLFIPWQLSEANFHFWAGVISVVRLKLFMWTFLVLMTILGLHGLV